MFGKLLIANRGEIACRIAATARRMGIATVAVYSDADAQSLHVAACDEAYRIGPAAARESYLLGPAIIAAARRSGAQAVHPGYGFLSENADFARDCAEAGLIFVGPPASAIAAMGSKSEAKALMTRAGVPVVPGYHGAAQDHATLRGAAAEIGYPVLIKASAGGGGKGMRAVAAAEDFDAALAAAQREAASAFGDDRVLIERYLRRPRHIEMQVFADSHGNVVHLFERDCSIQRRHQKVLEEAPAPGIDPALRAEMARAAIAAARSVGYVGAGTVEFIAEDGQFFFMEMNTRLQVEHPVTECVTGFDLVEWQLRVAAGEALPCAQDAIGLRGHAIEVRLYAEDPAQDFIPSVGRLTHLRLPAAGAGVRIDTGVREADLVTPHYDPMLAKLIVHGADRADSVRRMALALDEVAVAGVQTNLALLRAIVANPQYRAGDLDTGFIARHAPTLLADPAPPGMPVLIAAACGLLPDGAGRDPWDAGDNWRMNMEGWQTLRLRAGGETLVLQARRSGETVRLRHGTQAGEAIVRGEPGDLVLLFEGVRHRARVLRAEGGVSVVLSGRTFVFAPLDEAGAAGARAAGAGRVIAPIPGRLAALAATPGARVARGQVLVVLEAMKMEIQLSAGADAIVASVRGAVGDMVDEGQEIVMLEDVAPALDAAG